MNAARVVMTYALLAEFMRLPEGAQIRGIREKRFDRDRFELLIEHPDLAEVEEGFVPARIDLVYEHSPRKEHTFKFKT